MINEEIRWEVSIKNDAPAAHIIVNSLDGDKTSVKLSIMGVGGTIVPINDLIELLRRVEAHANKGEEAQE